jgi:hypothetical protein
MIMRAMAPRYLHDLLTRNGAVTSAAPSAAALRAGRPSEGREHPHRLLAGIAAHNFRLFGAQRGALICRKSIPPAAEHARKNDFAPGVSGVVKTKTKENRRALPDGRVYCEGKHRTLQDIVEN